MRKRWSISLLALALAGALTAGTVPARAAGPLGTLDVQFYSESGRRYGDAAAVDKVGLTLDGAPLDTDVPGLIQTVDGLDGRTMVPVRAIAEPLGADVLWMAETRQVMLFSSTDTIVLTLGSATAVVNGKLLTLPGSVPATVVRYNGSERTMVPLRFVSEQLHAAVDWDNASFSARITSTLLPPAASATPTALPTASATPTPLPTASPAPSSTPAPSPTASAAPTGPDLGMLLSIRSDDQTQTITLTLNCPPKYQITDLGDRVVLDLYGVTIGSGKDGVLNTDNGVIPTVRYAQHTTDLDPSYGHSVRVVMDLISGCTYRDNVAIKENTTAQTLTVSVTPPKGGGVTVPNVPLDPSAYTVVLDAGHGYYNGGTTGAYYEEIAEDTITLPITLKVEQYLKAAGYNVVMTRSDDVMPLCDPPTGYIPKTDSLYARARLANAVNADIFVSIHANSYAPNPSIQGTRTYIYPDSAKGLALAKYVHAATVASAGSKDQDILENNYVVLRETNMPACLVETGFMTCHEELMRLIQPEYQDKLARGIATGIQNYFATQPAKTAG